MNNTKILMIEDDSAFSGFVSEALQDDYQIETVRTGTEGIKSTKNGEYSLVLLDYNLPDLRGDKVCWAIKNHHNQAQPAIVFMSGTDTLELRLSAYDAGGDDFIAKPFSIRELKARLKRLANYHTRHTHALAQATENQSIAMQTMQEAAQYGETLHFVKATLSCPTEQRLAKCFFSYAKKLGLHSCLQFRNQNSLIEFDSVGSECSPIESNIFNLLSGQGRIYPFGGRTMFNDNHVSFLIKNMPVDNEILFGRYKDILAIAIEALEARYVDMVKTNALMSVQHQILSLTNELNDNMAQLHHASGELTEAIKAELGMSFHVLELDEKQEKYLSEMIENILTKDQANQRETKLVRDKLGGVMALLNNCMNETRLHDSDATEEYESDPFAENDDDSVELF